MAPQPFTLTDAQRAYLERFDEMLLARTPLKKALARKRMKEALGPVLSERRDRR